MAQTVADPVTGCHPGQQQLASFRQETVGGRVAARSDRIGLPGHLILSCGGYGAP